MQERVYDGSRMHAGTGMNHHSGGFVDGHDTRILIKYRERDIFGLGLQRGEMEWLDTNLFRTVKDSGWLARGPVHMHAGFADPGL